VSPNQLEPTRQFPQSEGPLSVEPPVLQDLQLSLYRTLVASPQRIDAGRNLTQMGHHLGMGNSLEIVSKRIDSLLDRNAIEILQLT